MKLFPEATTYRYNLCSGGKSFIIKILEKEIQFAISVGVITRINVFISGGSTVVSWTFE